MAHFSIIVSGNSDGDISYSANYEADLFQGIKHELVIDDIATLTKRLADQLILCKDSTPSTGNQPT